MQLLPVLASMLVGASAVLILAAGIEFVRMRSAREGARHRHTIGRGLAAVLGLVVLPRGIEERWGSQDLERRLRYAGLTPDGRAFAAARWLVVWLGLLLAVGVGVIRGWDLLGQFVAFLLLAGAWLGPGIGLQWRSERRRMEIDIALPDFLDRLALGLDAGMGFEVALRRTATDFRGLLGEDLRRLVRQLDRGHPRAEALRAMADATPSDDLHAFVAAVQQSDRLGTSLARALRVQTNLLRARRRRRAQEASRRLPILIVFPLVFFFLPALLIIYLAPPLLHLFLGR